MRWRGRATSENVEDRRGMGGPAMVGGGLGLMVIALVIALLGGNPQQFLQQAKQRQGAAVQQGQGAELTAQQIEEGEFAKTILADTEAVWTKLFAEAGKTYRKPTMVLFTGTVKSACGMASAAAGPFYCPADEKVYLDTSFFQQLSKQYYRSQHKKALDNGASITIMINRHKSLFGRASIVCNRQILSCSSFCDQSLSYG